MRFRAVDFASFDDVADTMSLPSCSPDMPADVTITENEIRVRSHRRAHLPIVLASGLIDNPVAVP
jgi:hypothetical protein